MSARRSRLVRWSGLPPLLALLCRGQAAWASPAEVAERGTGAPGRPFVRLQTQRTDRFVQEEFEFTVSVYSHGLVLGREIALSNQETTGLQFRPFRDRGSGREEIAGTVYDVRRFLGRAQALAPGSFEVRPTVRLSVVVPARGGVGPKAEGLSSGAEIRQAELLPLPLTVRVLPLPEAGKPAGFTGAVGTFALSAAIRPGAVAAGEPVTLSVEIRGRGNLGSLAAPAVPPGDSFRVYEPKLLRRELGEDGSEGRLVYEQVLVPRARTATSVPAVTFSYFDPERRSYLQLIRGPFPLAVGPGAHAEESPAAVHAETPVPAKPRLPAAIAPRKREAGAWKRLPVRPPQGVPWFLALQCVPLAIAVALYFATRRREELARNPAKARRQLAPTAADPMFDAAAGALREKNAADFHEALWQGLAAYFGNRFDLRPGEINGATVAERLAGAGQDPRDVARLGEIFALLEEERFGRLPGARVTLAAEEWRRLSGLLAEIRRLVRSCEGSAP